MVHSLYVLAVDPWSHTCMGIGTVAILPMVGGQYVMELKLRLILNLRK